MTAGFRTASTGPNPPVEFDQAVYERLFRLEHKLELARIQLELRTWLILVSIPASAVLLGMVLVAILRR